MKTKQKKTIRMVTFNVRGMKDATKRKAIFDWIVGHRIDIALLQETHCSARREEEQWSNE